MERLSVSIPSENRMRAFGACLGRLLEIRDFVGLVGDLGAGKTVLARGVAEGLGVPPGQVTSPTFAIVYTYEGRIPLHHADLYRLADDEELYATGFYDLLPGGATVVEWIDQVPEAAPQDRLLLRIERTGERTRRILLEPAGTRSRALAEELVTHFNDSKG